MADIPNGDNTESVNFRIDGDATGLKRELGEAGRIAGELNDNLRAGENAVSGIIERLIKLKGVLKDDDELADNFKSIMETAGSFVESTNYSLSQAVQNIRELLVTASKLGVNGNNVLGVLGGMGFGGLGGGLGGTFGDANLINLLSNLGVTGNVGSNQSNPNLRERTVNGSPESVADTGYYRRTEIKGGRQRARTLFGGRRNPPPPPGGPVPHLSDDDDEDPFASASASRWGTTSVRIGDSFRSTGNATIDNFAKAYPELYRTMLENGELPSARPARDVLLQRQKTVDAIFGQRSTAGRFFRNRIRNQLEQEERQFKASGDEVIYGGRRFSTPPVSGYEREVYTKVEQRVLGSANEGLGKFLTGLSDSALRLSEFGNALTFGYQAARQAMAPVQQLMQISEQYGSVNGSNNPMRALGLGLQAQFKSGFGFNPFVNSQQVAQAQMAGFGLGFNNNNSAYVSYAINAQNRYGMTGQTSAQYAQTGLAAGMNLQQINAMVGGLMMSTQGTNTSTSWLNSTAQSAVAQFGAAYGNVGGAGGAIAGGATAPGMNDQTLQAAGAAGNSGLASGSPMALAWLSKTLGIPYMQVQGTVANMIQKNPALWNQLNHQYDMMVLKIAMGGSIPPGLKQSDFAAKYTGMLTAITQSYGYPSALTSNATALIDYFYKIYTNSSATAQTNANKNMSSTSRAGTGGILGGIGNFLGNLGSDVSSVASAAGDYVNSAVVAVGGGAIGAVTQAVTLGNYGHGIWSNSMNEAHSSLTAGNNAVTFVASNIATGEILSSAVQNQATQTMKSYAGNVQFQGRTWTYDNFMKMVPNAQQLLNDGIAKVQGYSGGAYQTYSAFLQQHGFTGLNSTVAAQASTPSYLAPGSVNFGGNGNNVTVTFAKGMNNVLTQIANGNSYVGQTSTYGYITANSAVVPGANGGARG